MTFDKASQLFQQDKIDQLCLTNEGLRFLKLRSLSRKEHLERLFSSAGRAPTATGATALFREAFESDIEVDEIDSLIAAIYLEESEDRRSHEGELVSELYRMEVFDWGGLHQNSLEKTIVDNYVKKIRSFELLEQKIDNELHQSMRGFVLCQWYNHWTSIIIKDIFKRHPVVLPAVGLVKKIDFFVRGTPFDLKVTYFPEGYIADRRRGLTLRPELTLLKQCARRLNLHFDDDLPAGKLLEDIWKKLRDHPDSSAQALIAELQTFRMELLAESQADPSQLITWLYENQGVRRFDASNRLFLVLVDQGNFFESWKLKRAKPLLETEINRYLDGISTSPGRVIEFHWEDSSYKTRSDVLVISLPRNGSTQ